MYLYIYDSFSHTKWRYIHTRAQKYVALKILRAEVYGGEHEIFEREILRKVAKVSSTSNHEGRHHISYLLDEFKHTGPNGEHVCFVFDVLGHHLYHQAVHFKYERIPAEVMKIIARQLLLALDFLHRECGVIHTGMIMIISFSSSLFFFFFFFRGNAKDAFYRKTCNHRILFSS